MSFLLIIEFGPVFSFIYSPHYSEQFVPLIVDDLQMSLIVLQLHIVSAIISIPITIQDDSMLFYFNAKSINLSRTDREWTQ